MSVSPTVKYYVIAGLTIAVSVITYLSGHPGLTETTLIGAAMVALPLAIHDMENAP